MSREIHHDLPRQALERQISPEHLHSIQTSLKNITELPSSTLLLPDDLPFAETMYADAAQNDVQEPKLHDVVGRQWRVSDESSEIQVARYYPEFQKPLGKFTYQMRSRTPTAFGHIAFRKEVGPNSLSGYIFLLGNGDQVEEVNIKLERHIEVNDPNTGFLIRQFAGVVGVASIDGSLASGDEADWTGDITATYLQGREVAESLSALYHNASNV